MKITKQPSYCELNKAQLVSRIKWEFVGKPSALYGIYVKYRCLKPDIDMTEFVKLYDVVVAKSYEKIMYVDFVATHKTAGGVKVMVLPETLRYGDVVDIILEYGGYGTDRLKNLQKLDDTEVPF
jgi:hypothetical protein